MYSPSFGYQERWAIGAVISFSFSLLFFGTLVIPAALATGGSDTPTCPFESAEGITVVTLDKRLFPDHESAEVQDPVILPSALPAGTYGISLASRDSSHSHHPHEPNHQENESWFLVLENALGISIATTNAIDDLPDSVEGISQKVNDDLVLAEDVTQLRVRHAAYPSDSPNSITAVCAAFDLEETPEPPSGSTCGNEVREEGEMCEDGNTVSGDGCSAECTLETLMCEDAAGKLGWYGEYFNYSREHPAMNLPGEEWGAPYGDPLSATSTWTADWYDEQYFRFSRIDPTLSFGDDFFPFDVAAEELDSGVATSTHDYHFGAHWRARITGAPGEYHYTLTSDDDAWVYVDKELIMALPGVHPPVTVEGNLSLTGVNVIDLYFAERHTILSHFDFAIDGELEIVPLGLSCEMPGTISGEKYFDRNANGVRDEGEETLPGWEITLLRSGVRVAATSTDADGAYAFSDLAPGLYAVSEKGRDGWMQTSPATTSPHSFSVLGDGAAFSDVDFGNTASTSAIAGVKYEDINGDGARGEGEPGLSGWEINLSRGGILFATTTTATDGAYAFSDLAPITYTVTESLEEGWVKTEPAEERYTVGLVPGEVREGIDFGNHRVATTTLIISNEAEGNITETHVTLTWATNIPASSRVIYGTTSVPVLGAAPLYGYATTSPTDSALVMSHAVELLGLIPGTTYYWRAVSAASPEATGEEQSFITQSPDDDGSGDDEENGDGGNGGGGGVGGTEIGGGGGGGGGVFPDSPLAYGFTQSGTGGGAASAGAGEGTALFVSVPGSGADLPEEAIGDGAVSGVSGLTDGDADVGGEEDGAATSTNEGTQAAGLIFFGLDVRVWALILLAIAITLFIIWYSKGGEEEEEEENQPEIPFHT